MISIKEHLIRLRTYKILSFCPGLRTAQNLFQFFQPVCPADHAAHIEAACVYQIQRPLLCIGIDVAPAASLPDMSLPVA